MTLAERLRQDMIAALKSKQDLRLSTLRMALAAVKYKEVERRAVLDDAGVQQVLSTLIKQREDSAQQFDAGGRPELAAKERGEIAILNEYLPQAASDEEIEAAVRQAIAATGAQGAKDLG
ncbi:MAG: GatB/YqeY domain-containing protein, partial [Terriglobales bacterium]